MLAPGTLHAALSQQVGAGNGRTGGESLVGWLGSVKECSNRLRAYQRGAVVRSQAREIWCSEVGEPDCHQIVTIGGRFRPFGALSSGCRRKNMPGKFGTYRASSTPPPGLKILVSAVQSRPSPPFISTNCPSESFSRAEFVTSFVTNSGTFQRIPAHEPVFGETHRVERRGLRLLRLPYSWDRRP